MAMSEMASQTSPVAPHGRPALGSARGFGAIVVIVCFLALGNTTVVSSLNSTMLLFTNHVHFTSSTDPSFYVIALSLSMITPAFFSIPLGELSSRFGNGATICMAYAFSAIGVVVMIISRVNRNLYLIGYGMASIANSLRVLRFTILGEVVPTEHRSTAMALHQLAVPFGMSGGPLAWLFFQQWRFEKVVVPSVFVLDRFSMLYLFGIFVMFLLGVLSYCTLLNLHRADATPEVMPVQARTEVPVSAEYGSTNARPPIQQHANHPAAASPPSFASLILNVRFLYFAVLFLAVRFTFSIAKIVIQPALIEYFGADDEHVGKVFAGCSVFIFLAPLCAAGLARIVQDRYMLLCGFVLKVSGILLYSPIFGSMSEMQVVIGYIFVMMSTILCTTATISIFSKKMGRGFTGKIMGYMWAFANAFPAAVQIAFSNEIVSMFSKLSFVVFAIPSVVGLLLVVSPMGWRSLHLTKAQPVVK